MTGLAISDGFVNMSYLIESSVLKGYFSNGDECDIIFKPLGITVFVTYIQVCGFLLLDNFALLTSKEINL